MMKLVYNLSHMEDIYSLAGELKDLLRDDSRITALNELEKELKENQEVMALSYQKEVAVTNYSDALNHFAKDAPELKKYQHELFIKKEALDNHPLVQKYLKAYAAVRDLYYEVNEILFGDLSIHLKGQGE